MKSLSDASAALLAAAEGLPGAAKERERVRAARWATELDLLARDHGALYRPSQEAGTATWTGKTWMRVEWETTRLCVECGSDLVRLSRTSRNQQGERVRECVCEACGTGFQLTVKNLSESQRQNLASSTTGLSDAETDED
jgi:hypothetical protein